MGSGESTNLRRKQQQQEFSKENKHEFTVTRSISSWFKGRRRYFFGVWENSSETDFWPGLVEDVAPVDFESVFFSFDAWTAESIAIYSLIIKHILRTFKKSNLIDLHHI